MYQKIPSGLRSQLECAWCDLSQPGMGLWGEVPSSWNCLAGLPPLPLTLSPGLVKSPVDRQTTISCASSSLYLCCLKTFCEDSHLTDQVDLEL